MVVASIAEMRSIGAVLPFLAVLTAPDKDDYKVLVPTNLKYNHLGIKLYQRQEGKVRWKDSYPVDTNILDIPEDLLEYEKRYLVS
jgi:hypothetical protein